MNRIILAKPLVAEVGIHQERIPVILATQVEMAIRLGGDAPGRIRVEADLVELGHVRRRQIELQDGAMRGMISRRNRRPHPGVAGQRDPGV